MEKLLIATKNAHKTAEFRAVLSREWQVVDLCDYPQVGSPEETGDTFVENASIKALSASRVFSEWVLADDSGLEVDVLGGAPGVYSARYAGAGASDAANRERLLRELSGYPDPAQRRARFRCVLALARAGRIVEVFAGACEGRIQMQESGGGGFGYDAIFVPEGHSASFGELSPELKNQISHRAHAVKCFTEWTRIRAETECHKAPTP